MAVVRDIEPWDELLAGRARRTSGWSCRRRSTGAPARAVALPDGAAPRGRRRRCARAGIEQLWSHQAEALHAAWAGPDDRHDRHRVGQVAVLPAADARRALPRRRARARSTSTRPRRSRRTRRARCTRSASSARGRRSTTATRRASSAPRSAGARTSSSPTRTCSTSGSCPTTARGATSSPTSRSSWSTRRTSTAACSARTSRNVLRRLRRVARRLRDRAALPARQRDDRQPGRAGRAADRARRRHRDRPRRLARARKRTIAMWNPPIIDEKLGDAPLRRSPRRPTCSPSSSPRARARSCS